MKILFLTILIITATFGFNLSYAALCPSEGNCYFLVSQNQEDQPERTLAAIFNPTDPPEKIFAGLFNFLLGFVGIGAMVMIVIEGIKYMTSAGDQSKIGEAKRKIWNAVWGLILALISYILLQTINPDLLKSGLKSINLQRQEGLQTPQNPNVVPISSQNPPSSCRPPGQLINVGSSPFCFTNPDSQKIRGDIPACRARGGNVIDTNLGPYCSVPFK